LPFYCVLARGFKDETGKFHPTGNSGIKKTPTLKSVKTEGVKMEKLETVEKEEPKLEIDRIRAKLSENQIEEWEDVARSEVIDVKQEHVDGMPVLTVMFQNGDEWFEFDQVKHQERFIDSNELTKSDAVGKFIKVDHPMIEGYINLITGKSLFETKEKV